MILIPPVLHLLGRQHNVASLDQLREFLSRSQLDRASAQGLLIPELPGIRRLAGSVGTWSSRVMALSLYAGDSGFVSGFTAARRLGVESAPRSVLEVTVDEGRSPQLPRWAKVHRTSWRVLEDQLALATGELISAPLRTLFRCAAVCGDVRFEKIAEQMWNRKLITPAEAAEFLARHRRQGRRGVTRFERWLEKAIDRPRPSQSSLEVDLAAAVVAAGLPEPQRQVEVTLRNGETIHLDIAWPRIRFGVEPGATFWHTGEERIRADRARDRACDEVGWRVIRYDDVELRNLPGCVAEIERIYGQRLQDFARNSSAGA